eukprot:COSAG06_NODE_5848_length_3247_cov_2.527954_2_plen_66_part_00
MPRHQHDLLERNAVAEVHDQISCAVELRSLCARSLPPVKHHLAVYLETDVLLGSPAIAALTAVPA